MTKQLFILRHAEARLKQGSESDRDRPLTIHGHNQAHAAGLFLQTRKGRIDQILCSDARRTRETLDGIRASGCPLLPDAEFLPDLYALQDIADFAACLRTHADPTAQHLLVIGHNPVVHQAVGWLATPTTDIGDLAFRYDPASMAVFDLAIDAWAGLRPQCGQLVDSFIAPSANT